MTTSHVGRLLRAQVEEEIDKYKNDLAAGSASDFSRYQFQVGFMQGMNRVLQVLEGIERED